MIAILLSVLIAVIATVAIAALAEAIGAGRRAIQSIARQLAELEGPQRAVPRLRPVKAAAARRPLRRTAGALRAAA